MSPAVGVIRWEGGPKESDGGFPGRLPPEPRGWGSKRVAREGLPGRQMTLTEPRGPPERAPSPPRPQNPLMLGRSGRCL